MGRGRHDPSYHRFLFPISVVRSHESFGISSPHTTKPPLIFLNRPHESYPSGPDSQKELASSSLEHNTKIDTGYHMVARSPVQRGFTMSPTNSLHSTSLSIFGHLFGRLLLSPLLNSSLGFGVGLHLSIFRRGHGLRRRGCTEIPSGPRGRRDGRLERCGRNRSLRDHAGKSRVEGIGEG